MRGKNNQIDAQTKIKQILELSKNLRKLSFKYKVKQQLKKTKRICQKQWELSVLPSLFLFSANLNFF